MPVAKVVALFDRAEARDFTDVHALARRFGKDAPLELAAEVDRGLDQGIFVQMLTSLARFADADLLVPTAEISDVRGVLLGLGRRVGTCPEL